jgi:hypothetical protein
MGNAMNWFRGQPPEDTEKILKELDEKILVQREALAGFVASHKWWVALLLKVFVPLEVVIIAWFWLRQRPVEVLLQLRDGLFVLVPPLVWFASKRVVDSWYTSRVRRDEARLRDLFDHQVRSLKSIEEDPVFRKKMDLLQKYGKNVPSYAVPQTPLAATPQSQVKQRVVPIQAQPQSAPAPQAKVHHAPAPSPSAPLLGATSPKTPKVYQNFFFFFFCV